MQTLKKIINLESRFWVVVVLTLECESCLFLPWFSQFATVWLGHSVIMWLFWHWDMFAIRKGCLGMRRCLLVRIIWFHRVTQGCAAGWGCQHSVCVSRTVLWRGESGSPGWRACFPDLDCMSSVPVQEPDATQVALGHRCPWDGLPVEKLVWSLLLSTCTGCLAQGGLYLTLECGQEGLSFLSPLLKHKNGIGTKFQKWTQFHSLESFAWLCLIKFIIVSTFSCIIFYHKCGPLFLH